MRLARGGGAPVDLHLPLLQDAHQLILAQHLLREKPENGRAGVGIEPRNEARRRGPARGLSAALLSPCPGPGPSPQHGAPARPAPGTCRLRVMSWYFSCGPDAVSMAEGKDASALRTARAARRTSPTARGLHQPRSALPASL